MISKVCVVLLLSCVLAQANPLSTRLRRADPGPEASAWKMLNQITIGLKSPIDALVTGVAMTSQAVVSELVSVVQAAMAAANGTSMAAATVAANGTSPAVEMAGGAVASGVEKVGQTLLDAASIQVEAQMADHVATNPFGAIVGF